MESLFEPSSYLDSSSPFDPSSFLTFSSFADLTASPHSISDTWDEPLYPSSSSSSSFSSASTLFNNNQQSCSSKYPIISTSAPHYSAYSTSSDCSSSPGQLFDPFEIINSAFEGPALGIFHTPSQYGPTKLSAADVAPGLTHRVTPSSDSGWGSPLITPALGEGSNVSPIQPSQASFSWDDAPATLASSSSYTPPTTAVSPVPLRVASNPSIGAHKNPRAIKNISSMPALKEEVDNFSWFDGNSLLDQSEPVIDEALVDNFDWVFGDYGLGDSLPMEGTIFAAFHEQGNSSSEKPTPISLSHTSTSPIEVTDNKQTDNSNEIIQNNLDDLSAWLNGSSNTSQSVNTSLSSAQNFDYSQNFTTIDPTVLGGSSASRPSSAPRADGGEIMLGAPIAGQMARSLTAPGFVPTHDASELFSYDPQSQYPGSYAPPQQYYGTAQTQPIRALPQRRASHGLTISVNQPAFSTFNQASDLPAPPHSAPYTSTSMMHQQAQAQSAYAPMQSHLQAPVPMARAGTQPLPARRMSANAGPSSNAPSQSAGPSMPAHLVRAQAIVQMQEAKEEKQRQELRRQAASRKVGMAEASVMQPLTSAPLAPPPPPHQRGRPAIVGWDGPSSLPNQSHMPSGMNMLGSALTTQPLIVHPPPSYYNPAPTSSHAHPIYHPNTQFPAHIAHQHQIHPQPIPHRVHPPPHPGMPSNMGQGVGLGMANMGMAGVPRPMARLPSSPKGIRKTSSPKKSPGGAKARRAPMQPGGFSWGEATFINFTPDDAEKLLTGVAPSGSQAKRKREEDAARMGGMGMGGGGQGEFLAVEMDRDGSKRSRGE